MGKKTKIFYWIIRIITIGILITALLGFIYYIKDEVLRNTFIAYFLNASGLLIFTFVPDFLIKRNVRVPALIANIYILMLAAALLLGEIMGFYRNVRGWDSLLHFSTPGLIGLFAYSLINLLNPDKTLNKLTPLFVSIFTFSFIMMTGVIWEIFEFFMDSVLGYNMQRYINDQTGEPFIGQRALFDTMKDFMLNTLGAVITSVVIYFDAKSTQRIARNLTLQIIDKNSSNIVS